MNAYGYIIKWGKSKETLNHDSKFLIFANSQDAAKNYCKKWVADEIKLERNKIEQYGGEGNYWWRNYSIEEVDIKNLDNEIVNVKYLNE